MWQMKLKQELKNYITAIRNTVRIIENNNVQ